MHVMWKNFLRNIRDGANDQLQKGERAKTNRIDFLMYAKLFLEFSTFQTLPVQNL